MCANGVVGISEKESIQMMGLLDGIKKMTDDELRLQISLFENVTITNAVKETGFRVVEGIKDFANALTEAFGSKAQIEYEVKKVSDVVADRCLELRTKSREELLEQLKGIVIRMVRDVSGVEETNEIPEERLHKILVDEADKAFSIEKYKPIANKIDEIIIEYNNAFLKTLHNQLIKETPEQKKVTDQLIQNRMNAVSIESKRQLQQKVMPKEFNGQGVGRVLRTERNTKYLQEVITYLGLEALDCGPAQVLTVLMAMKGLKRPTRMQLARFVWSVGSKRGRKYAYAQDILPGYVPADRKEEFNEHEKEFRLMMQQQNTLLKKREQKAKDLERQQEQQSKEQKQLEESMERYDGVHLRFTELESQKDDYIGGKHSEQENKVYYADVNETKRNLDHAQKEYERLRRRLHEQADKVSGLASEYEGLSRELEHVQSAVKDEVDRRAKKLQLEWKAYYYKFQFEEEVFQSVVMACSSEERLCLESMLKELHDSSNPENLRDEEIEDVSKVHCYMAPGKNVVITYQGRQIRSVV